MLEQLEDTIDDVRDQAVDFLNSEGRSGAHVALGIGLTLGVALLATATATGAIKPAAARRSHRLHGDAPVTERPRGPLSLVLPAVFSATTLSAIRVWNAPSVPARRSAMQLWALAQGVNATWLAARPRSLPGQVLAAMTTAGLAAAFAHQARKLDRRAGMLAAPFGAATRIANRVDKAVDDRPTVH